MPPSGTSRSIMSLSERRGFKQRGGGVIGTALPVVLQCVYQALMWQHGMRGDV